MCEWELGALEERVPPVARQRGANGRSGSAQREPLWLMPWPRGGIRGGGRSHAPAEENHLLPSSCHPPPASLRTRARSSGR